MNAKSPIDKIQNSPAAAAARDAYFAAAESAPTSHTTDSVDIAAKQIAQSDQAIVQQTVRLKALLDRWEQRHADSAQVDSYFTAHAEADGPHIRNERTSPSHPSE